MAKLKTILFYYNLSLTFILLIIGLFTQGIFSSPQFLIIILPLIIYFWGYLILNSNQSKTLSRQSLWVGVILLLVFNLISTTVLTILNFSHIKSLSHFFISLLYLPYPLYFFLTIFHWYQKLNSSRPSLANPTVSISPTLSTTSPQSLPVISSDVMDQNRRKFLKLIGGTSLSLIVLSLFNPKEAGAAFFGSVPGPGTVSLKDATGAKINPAEKQPTDGYKISQIDDDDYPSYYGYVHKSGAWYIMREDQFSNYRYTKGISDFAINWELRNLSLTYDYFDTVFG